MIRAQNAQIGTKLLTGLVGLLLTVEAVDKLNIENKKAYIQESGEWLLNNTDKDIRLYSNNKLVVYYANKNQNFDLNDLYSYDMLIRNLDYEKLQNYEYVAYATISSFRLDTIATQRLSREYGDLAHQITGYGGQTVSIFRRFW